MSQCPGGLLTGRARSHDPADAAGVWADRHHMALEPYNGVLELRSRIPIHRRISGGDACDGPERLPVGLSRRNDEEVRLDGAASELFFNYLGSFRMRRT